MSWKFPRGLRRWLLLAALACLLVLLVSLFVEINQVPTGSMAPTIQAGDGIVINKLAYGLCVPLTHLNLLRWASPQRGDVVVLDSPADGQRLVKRIVAQPGDKIEMLSDRLLVNGKFVQYLRDEPFCSDSTLVFTETIDGRPHRVQVSPGLENFECFGPLVVPAGHYFVMGDNRDHSRDSRCFGFVPAECILGKAVGLAFSLDAGDGYRPRWKRFFRGLS